MAHDNGHDSSSSSTERLTPVSALRLVSEFLSEEWALTKVEGVHLKTITGGFCHRLSLITRDTPSIQEPASVLIRQFGTTDGKAQDPIESSTTLSAAEQALIYYEMGRRGWGPKVYGVFRGGRLEEYIDSHPLTAEECKDAEIQRDVARSYARLHSLDLPLRKNNITKILAEFQSLLEAKSKERIAQRLDAMDLREAKEFASILRSTDWKQELQWVGEMFERHQCKKAIAIGDANYLNLLVKNCPSDCNVMLIDYETATYSYRGIDIGGHFNERMYQWGDPKNPFTGHPIPDIEERRRFCESYLGEMSALEITLTKEDTVDHLLLESEVGQLYQLMFSVFMGLEYDGLGDATLLTGLIHMLDTYHGLKQDFLGRTRRPQGQVVALLS